MASKIKGLQQWCKRMTDGYRGVEVRDFTVSWRDGLAFCALIHRFRPDLIDFDSLSKENVFDNNHLAFTVAEKELDIPAFLEASDMVALKTPDKLSIITYVSQYYNKLGSLPQLGGPGVQGKTTPVAPAGVKRHQKPEPLSEPEPKKVPPSDATKGSKTSTLGDKCKICGNKVYLLERHVEGGQLYHRSCYRHSDLSPTNKVYTRSPFFSPSLHGKDENKTSTPKSPAEAISLNKPADLSRTYDLDNKHVSKVHETSHTDNKKTGPQRFLFPDKEKTSNSMESCKFEAKDSKHQAGDGYLSKDIHWPSDVKLSTSASSTEKNKTKSEKTVTATPTFDARTFEKHSVDFLSPEKDAKDVKTPKRQLPLIFQSPDSANDSTSGTSTKPAPVEVDTSAVQKDSGFKSTFPINKGTGDKSTGPVAKPRNFVKKVGEEKMDTTETVYIRERSAVPKPTPRAAVTSLDLTHKNKTPPSARKNAPRPKSPAKDLSPESTSPPPLPSAPPPLPLSEPPSSSHLPSTRHPPSSYPSSYPPKHEPAVHPGSTAREVHTVQKSSHSAAPAKTFSASVSTATPSSSNNKVPALARPLPGLTSVSHPPKTVHNATSDVTAASHPPRTSHTSSHTATIGASSGDGSHSTVIQPKPAQAVFSISTDVRKEEPMDINTAVSKARAQYGEEPVAVMVTPSNKGEREKATKTGLLHSLANVRHTSSSSPSAESGKKSTVSITINTTTTHTTLSASASKTSGKSHTSGASHTKTTNATGFVSSKMNQFQTKENEGKTGVESALKPKVHSEHGDSSAHRHTPHKAGSSAVSTTTTTEVHETRTDTKVSDYKVHDLGTPSTALKRDKPPSSVLANVELRAPQRNGKGTHFDSTDERTQSTLSSSVARRDRSKSAADVLDIKELSAKKETTSSEAPAFLQVKLRNANTTEEKKERPKSVGSLLETEDDSSKPVWQMEAERRMAALRDTGFVDPETKKVSGGGDDRNTQQEISKPVKNGTGNVQPSVIVPQKVTTDFSHGDEGADTRTALHSKTEIIKVPQKSQIQITIGKPAVSSTETEKDTKVSHRIKVLPTIIKPGQVTAERLHTNEEDKAAPGIDLPPVKPERTHKRAVEEKTVEPKTRSYVSEVNVKDKVAPQAPAETESQRVLKKLTLGALKDGHTPPRRPSSPPKQPRKKISVNVSFNFNTNNAGSSPEEEAPSVTSVVTPVIKHTPPPRPPPPRASVSPGRLSAIELQQQLLDIDSKLTELELRGRELEDSIRSVDTGETEDDMMAEWFQLVTDKNDLVRQETDLVYMTRETALEDEQSQIENQLRYLLSKEEREKSFEEQKEEEYLIQRKLDIVNQRNCIVDSIDEDRLRYEEEDRDIAQMLQSRGMSKDSSGHLMNEKGKKVAASTFYT